jgi:ABC-2 type transport system permease protein
VASVWLREGEPVSKRGASLGVLALSVGLLCVASARVRTSSDLSEDRRNSFSRADEAALSAIREPLHVTVYLAAEDPRLVDLERGVIAKLQRTMPDVRVTYAAGSRSGLFEKPNEHYGEVWYELAGKRAMSRSTTEPIVLETIYELAGQRAPTPIEEAAYAGYPLAVRPTAAPWVFFVIWPACVIGAWWLVRRSRLRRISED